MAKGKKMDFKKVAMKVLVVGGAGAVVQVVTEALASTNQNYVDYGLIAAGIILPEVVKGSDMVEDASAALLAVGAYKMAERLDLSGKLGITTAVVTPKTTGLRDFSNIGSGWSPERTYQAKKVNNSQKSDVTGSAVK